MLACLASYAVNCRSLVGRLLLIGSGKVKHRPYKMHFPLQQGNPNKGIKFKAGFQG